MTICVKQTSVLQTHGDKKLCSPTISITSDLNSWKIKERKTILINIVAVISMTVIDNNKCQK